MIGKKYIEQYPNVRSTKILEQFKNVMENNAYVDFEQAYDNEGIKGWFRIKAAKLDDGLVSSVEDITDKKRAEEKLMHSELEMRSIIDNTQDIITRWDKNLKLVFTNKIFEIKTGWSSQELLGKDNIEMGQPKHIALPYMQKLKYVFKTGKPAEYYNSLLTLNGVRNYFSTLVPELDSNGEIHQVLAIGRDITELNITKEELFTQRQQLLESRHSLEKKDEFIGIASHELKTPVTSIKAYAEFVEESLRQQQDILHADYMCKMISQINKLTNLIKDLLDVTKMQSGKLIFNEAFFDFNEMLSEVIEELQRINESHKIVSSFQPTVKVYGDRFRIAQVVSNLIINAVKYSPASNQISLQTTVNNNEEVMLCVDDSGIGIAEENRSKVFDRFYRVKSNKDYTFPGLGLGLYIASEIIKQEGGHIWVESTEGKGSSFCFTIPLDHRKNKVA